jgi:hypothetical protein
MPLALIIIGTALIVSAFRNTQDQLGAQLVKDFTGAGNFLYWFAAIAVVGAVGYATKFSTVSRLFLVLILIVIVLSNGGVFEKAVSALKTTAAQPVQQPATPEGPLPIKVTLDMSGSGSSGGAASGAVSGALGAVKGLVP